MFKTRGGGGVKSRLNNVKKTDNFAREGVPKTLGEVLDLQYFLGHFEHYLDFFEEKK